jgi:hypothetical protein
MTLLDEALSTPLNAADRRRSPREERSTMAWLSASTGAKAGNGFNVQVRDLSLHGIGFVSSRKLAKDEYHWLVIADRSLRLSTRVRIVALRERPDGQFDVGGEFF